MNESPHNQATRRTFFRSPFAIRIGIVLAGVLLGICLRYVLPLLGVEREEPTYGIVYDETID